MSAVEAAMVAALDAGQSNAAVAKEFGVSVYAVLAAAKKKS